MVVCAPARPRRDEASEPDRSGCPLAHGARLVLPVKYAGLGRRYVSYFTFNGSPTCPCRGGSPRGLFSNGPMGVRRRS